MKNKKPPVNPVVPPVNSNAGPAQTIDVYFGD